MIAAQELVPDDIVRLRVGDIVPADALLMDGHIAVDQSMLTGRSELVEVQSSGIAYAASVIRRGEGLPVLTPPANLLRPNRRNWYRRQKRLIMAMSSSSKIVTNLLMLTLVLAGLY
ncbi:MAG: hypothetical protein U0528_01400 [Anaerolineae bacterium]